MMVADGNDTAEQDDELIQMRVVRNVLRFVTAEKVASMSVLWCNNRFLMSLRKRASECGLSTRWLNALLLRLF